MLVQVISGKVKLVQVISVYVMLGQVSKI